jgi:hypothetical protein
VVNRKETPVLKSIAISLLTAAMLPANALLSQQLSVPGSNVSAPQGAAPSTPTAKPPAAQSESASDSAPPIDYSVTALALSPGKPVSGVGGSFAIMQPVQCTAEGQVLAEMPVPSDFKSFRVASLSQSRGRDFDFKSIPNLYDTELFTFFPSDSDVMFLFYATEESKVSDYRMTTDKGKVISGKGNQTEHHSYAVRFGLDGQYKSTTRLPDGQVAHKIAALGSDQLLVLSYDRVNRVPILRVLDSGGRPVSSVQLPSGLTDYAVIKQGETGDSMNAGKAESSVSGWQFIPARGKVLLFRPQSNSPVLEIGSGGFRREVPIAAPPGFELDGFIPSTKQWYARFRRSGAGEGSAPVSRGDYIFAELNPSDGSIYRLFKMDSNSIFDVACEADGEFISVSFDNDKFLLSSTDVPH